MTDAPTCRKCGGTMKPSKAMAQTYTAGSPDFPGDDHVSTYSAGGPGKVVDCIKCEGCGHSVTDTPEMPEVIWAIRSDADNTILYGFTYPSPANGIDTPYTLQVTHEAAMAEKDARIAKLVGAMRECLWMVLNRQGDYPDEAAQYLCLLNDELMAAEGGEG